MNVSDIPKFYGTHWRVESLSWRHYNYAICARRYLYVEGTIFYELLKENLGNPCKSGYGRWYLQNQKIWIQEKDMSFLFMKYPFLIESKID